MKRCKNIIDIYRDDELIVRIHHDVNDKTAYEEMTIKVEDDGKYIQTISIKGKK